jgi:gluconolactonase
MILALNIQRASTMRQFSPENKARFFCGVAAAVVAICPPRMKKLLLPLAVLLASTAAVFSEGVVAPGAKLEKLSGDFAFTEGATCDKDGNVFFTDQPNDRIMKWSTDGKLSTFLQPSGRANGMEFDASGNLIVCADEHNQVWSIAPDKTVTVLITNFEGKYFNGPNDVWIAPNGGIYLTDPYYKRDYWDHTKMALTNQEAYYLSPDHRSLVRVTDDLKQCNGITGTPDGKTLFISDLGGGRTWRYDIQPDGTLTNKTLICSLGSDGMTIDTEGNLYLCGHGVTVFDKTGKKIDHIDVPETWTGNVCFSGKDRKALFISSGKSLYSIQLLFAGANAAK